MTSRKMSIDKNKMKPDLRIPPVKQTKTDCDDHESPNRKKTPDILPQKHFLLVVCAPVRSGKTNLLKNLLCHETIDCSKHYEDVVFIMPTIENDRTGRHIVNDERVVKIVDDLNNLDLILESMVEVQKQRLKKKERSDTLLILDDCPGLLGHHNSCFSTSCSEHRHFRLSIITTTQSFKAVPNICRHNATAYIPMRPFNKKQCVAMEEELEGNHPEFAELHKTATKERHSFLHLDMEKTRAHRNFDELIYDGDAPKEKPKDTGEPPKDGEEGEGEKGK